MTKNPVYDNDYVTLGYLNEQLSSKNKDAKEELEQIPKNYNTYPNPPYYKDSLLLLDKKIYKCIKSRLVGSFNISDWKIVVATNEIESSLKSIFDVNKFQYVDQVDDLIETFYQENDPSIEWNTDILKNVHVSDLWTKDNLTIYQYTKNATNPVTYSWKQIKVPISLFDVVDGYKKIFLTQPSNYSKGDLWLGKITKIAINDNENFTEADWEDRDDFIENSETQQEEYHEIYLVPNITEINRQSLSEIKKAIDFITLTVSQTYTTKTEVNQYIDGVKGDIAKEYTTTEEMNSQIEIISNQINSNVTNIKLINDTLATINSTILQQTDDRFQMLFQQSGIQASLDELQNLVDNQNATLEEIKAYIDYGTITDTESEYYGSPYILLGSNTMQTKLRLLAGRIQFLTDGIETAYISNNQMYINESAVIKRQKYGSENSGIWIFEVPEDGNLDIYWGGE